MSLAELRREYSLGELRREALEPDPIAQFKKWFDQATGARASGRVRQLLIRLYKSLLLISGAEPMDLNAMILATADKLGRPSARVVLLKGVDERGFIFYTNFQSRKGQELAENPHAALVFYWAGQERQATVAGEVRKLPQAESEAYFRSRPRGSRLAAWASHQGEVLADRAALEARWKEYDARYSGQEVPMPPYWGGYVLAPARIEFWQGRPNRLHDRFRYSRQPGETWLIERLDP
ncbi:MAG TPA: pyridoxamine 5'-phosphate oxidase [Dongiaceae bacterium]|nr:pyridoxamine 5'-phosphate oxidase [Dongiaceae bacterium]